jgi:hypothetical protein
MEMNMYIRDSSFHRCVLVQEKQCVIDERNLVKSVYYFGLIVHSSQFPQIDERAPTLNTGIEFYRLQLSSLLWCQKRRQDKNMMASSLSGYLHHPLIAVWNVSKIHKRQW